MDKQADAALKAAGEFLASHHVVSDEDLARAFEAYAQARIAERGKLAVTLGAACSSWIMDTPEAQEWIRRAYQEELDLEQPPLSQLAAIQDPQRYKKAFEEISKRYEDLLAQLGGPG